MFFHDAIGIPHRDNTCMENEKMDLFEKILHNQDKITLMDLLSGVKEKHTNRDVENALLAGTSIDSAYTESTMLQKWKAPWLYLRVLGIGLIFSLILIVLTAITGNIAVSLLYVMFCSCVVPVSLMFFFWEMNVPRNISIFHLMLCFFAGGLFSIASSLLLFNVFNISASFLAPIPEEPGKLAISLLVLCYIGRNKKIYGMTGLVIGAAVGAGFAAFENAQYVYGNFYTFEASLNTLLTRSLCNLSSHVLFCAPYVTVAALNMQNNKFNMNFFKGKNFWKIFGFSCLMHVLWNFSAVYLGQLMWLVFILELFLEWKLILKLIRDCFVQISTMVPLVNSGSVLATDLKIQCINGIHVGRKFAFKRNEILVGTDSLCNLVFPLGTVGINNRHCKLVIQNNNLYLADIGSQSGTFLNGTRLKPMKGILLKKGDVFWIGSENEKFKVV